ncbi:hypothetical protein FBU30_006166 [Linnemannia zychae]|nr:hypothetical protein FBU30_006166 [Linnemannia zychae]
MWLKSGRRGGVGDEGELEVEEVDEPDCESAGVDGNEEVNNDDCDCADKDDDEDRRWTRYGWSATGWTLEAAATGVDVATLDFANGSTIVLYAVDACGISDSAVATATVAMPCDPPWGGGLRV